MNNQKTLKTHKVSAVVASIAVVAITAILVFVAYFGFGAGSRGVGSVDSAGTDSDSSTAIGSNPTEVQLASFAADMSELYASYDSQKSFLQKVEVDAEGRVSIFGSTDTTYTDIASEVSADEIYVDAAPYIAALGYSEQGIVAKDNALLFTDGTSVDIQTTTAANGALLYKAADIAQALGCDVLAADAQGVSVSFPYQSARIIVSSYSDVYDDAAVAQSQSIDNMYVLQYDSALAAKTACERFASDPNVESVGPDRIYFLAEVTDSSQDLDGEGATPANDKNAILSSEDADNSGDVSVVDKSGSNSDESIIPSADEWKAAEAISWGNDVVGSAQAQERIVYKYGSEAAAPEVVVAVIDSGVQLDHELLAGRLIEGYDFIANDSDPSDENGHGTHCAGVIVNNTAANVKVMPVRASDAEGSLTESSIYSSIEYAIKNGANVLSMSFGGFYDSTSDWFSADNKMQIAIRDAEKAGVVMAAAQGNDSRETVLQYPAADVATISVSAIDEKLTLASYSNYGSVVDLCAPGTGINSSWLGETNNTYTSQDGTSMATPFVAACAALVYSENPTATSAQVREILQDNATDLGEVGWDKRFGYGCVYVGNRAVANNSISTAVARVNSVESSSDYDSLSAALQAAAAGDTITLLQDVALDQTLVVNKDVTIRSNRSQSITNAAGFDGALIEVAAGCTVTIGDSAESTRELQIASTGAANNAVVFVDAGGSLTLLDSVTVEGANTSNGAGVVVNNGSLVLNGATITNKASIAEGVEGAEGAGSVEGAVSATNADGATDVISASDEGELASPSAKYAVATSGTVTLDGASVLNGEALVSGKGGLLIAANLDSRFALLAVTVVDPVDGRVVATFAEGASWAYAPIYSTLSDWTFVVSGNNVVLKSQVTYDAKVGEATYQTLSAAIAAAVDGDTVTICRDITLNEPVVITKDITLNSAKDCTILALTKPEAGALQIASGANVAFVGAEDAQLTIDGANVAGEGALVGVAAEAKLTLGANVSLIRGSAGGVVNSGALKLDGAVIASNYTSGNGAGICNSGVLEVVSGRISDNIAYGAGGGIYNGASGACTISGGEISGNKVTYNDYAELGEMSHDYSNPNGTGGGVFNIGTLTLTAGVVDAAAAEGAAGSAGLANVVSITGNSATALGGGVSNFGTAIMEAGQISGNFVGSSASTAISTSAWGEGSGVYNSGTFTMEDGLICDNDGYVAAGVYADPAGCFKVLGGEISGTTCSNSVTVYDLNVGAVRADASDAAEAEQGKDAQSASRLQDAADDVDGADGTNDADGQGQTAAPNADKVAAVVEGGKIGNTCVKSVLEVGGEATFRNNIVMGGGYIRVVSALSAGQPILLDVEQIMPGSKLVEYAEGVNAEAAADIFKLVNNNPVYAGGAATLALKWSEADGTYLYDVEMAPASEGWTAFGSSSCEYKIEGGTMTVRPLGGATSGVIVDVIWSASDSDLTIDDADSLSEFEAAFANVKRMVFEPGVVVLNASAMFRKCANLEYVDISSVDFSSSDDMDSMFSECSALREVKLPSVPEGVTSMNGLFSGCDSLVRVTFAEGWRFVDGGSGFPALPGEAWIGPDGERHTSKELVANWDDVGVAGTYTLESANVDGLDDLEAGLGGDDNGDGSTGEDDGNGSGDGNGDIAGEGDDVGNGDGMAGEGGDIGEGSGGIGDDGVVSGDQTPSAPADEGAGNASDVKTVTDAEGISAGDNTGASGGSALTSTGDAVGGALVLLLVVCVCAGVLFVVARRKR